MNLSTGKYWTDPWNCVVGCSPCSEGCKCCWSAATARRQEYSGLVTNGAWNGQVRFRPEVLEAPLHWRKPRMVAVCWMGDLFHENVPDEWIDRAFSVMALCPQHRFLILTKRPHRMTAYLDRHRAVNRLSDFADLLTGPAAIEGYARALGMFQWPPPWIWLGTSAENQEMLDKRLPELFRCGPGWHYWLSIEPFLGPVDVRPYLGHCRACNPSETPGYAIEGVVLGAEMGSGARTMMPDWARKVRDDCGAAGVPFFFKGWGEWCDWIQMPEQAARKSGSELEGYTTQFYRVGRNAAGRLLDGREHNELGWA